MNNAMGWRKTVGRIGYGLVSCGIVVTAILWYWTCGMGGYHCFDGAPGDVVAGAQIGILAGLVANWWGKQPMRWLFVLLALADFACVYLQLLVH
jgi:hypothetical protein